VKGPIHHVSKFWSTDWSLTAFLVILILVVFIIEPLARLNVANQLLVTGFFSVLFISGVAAVARHWTVNVLSIGLAGATIVLRWMAHLFPSPGIESLGAFSSLVFVGFLAGVVLLHVFRSGPITSDRVQGAIAVYLLLGLMWAFLYRLIFLWNPGSFQPPNVVQQQGSPMADLIYFSFTTLTTLGYGDIVPVDPMARSLAVLEALVGQLYPAILIGRLVSMELQFRQSK